MAALETHHDVGLLRQPIDDLAFALVAPLGSDNYDIRHQDLPCASARTLEAGSRRPGPPSDKGCIPLRQAIVERGYRWPQKQQRLDLTRIFRNAAAWLAAPAAERAPCLT